jgi:branched-chain amino acid transport system permease protein
MMLFEQILQSMINGVLLGGIYACFGLGVSLIWGVMKASNFAHGAVGFLAAYISFSFLTQLSINPIIALIVLIPLFFGLGMLIYQVMIYPAYLRTTQLDFELSTMLLTFGLSLVLESVMSYFWGTEHVSESVRFFTTHAVAIGDYYVATNGLVAFGLAAISVAIVAVLLDRTRFGLAIRAVSQNKEVASMMGVNVYMIWLLSFGITIALGALGGVTMSLLYAYYPQGNLLWTIKAFIVVVLGGIGSIPGTLVGGILLGISENVGGTVLPFAFRDVVALAIFLIVLLVRPQGMFGRK